MELPAKIKGMHFLICDDFESMRVMMMDSLKRLGVTNISEADSGNAGFQKILESHKAGTPVEFVVTDLVMENGTGIELAKKVRAHPDTAKVPILMVTSKAEVSFVLESVKAGVSGYIVKPWQLEDLHKKIIDVEGKKK